MAEINSIGFDIILDGNGDFQTTSSGDIFSATDELNIVQAIKHRIITEQGDLVYNTDYGMNYNILFTKKTPAAIKAIKSAMIREVSKDPRVKRIVKIEAFTQTEIEELRPDQLYIEIDIVPINRDEVIGINFVYPQFTSPSFANAVVSEYQTSFNRSTVFTNHVIKSVNGVFLASDTNKTGVNYFIGGNFNGRQITLGTFLNVNTANLIVDYITYETTRNTLGVRLIQNENVTATSDQIVSVESLIYDVAGIFLSSDTEKAGTNYWFNIDGTTYKKGSFEARQIVLAQKLPLGSTVFETTATEEVFSGQIEMAVADASGFAINQFCLIDKNLSTQEFIKIREIEGNVLKFASNLTQDHINGFSNVELNTNQITVDYSSSERLI